SAFLFLIALGYALSRLFYPQPVLWESLSSDELDSIQIDLTELERLTGQLMRRWVYGLVLPPLGGLLGQIGGELARLPWRQREPVTLGSMAFFALIALVLLSLNVAAVLRSPAVAERVLFRKIISTIPWSYFFGALGVALPIAAVTQHLVDVD